MRKKICIIGLGRFGSRLCETLADDNATVLAIDSDESKVDAVKDLVEEAVVADVSSSDVLRSLIPKDCDSVIVSLAGNIEASVLCTLALKKLGIEHIVCRASSREHSEILSALGATEVIFAEWDSADNLARKLINPNIMDYLPLFGGFEIAEISVPAKFVGSSIKQLDVRNKYGLYILGVTHSNRQEMEVMPDPERILSSGERILVLGNSIDIKKIR